MFKYLYLIIRHIWPRSKWRVIDEADIYGHKYDWRTGSSIGLTEMPIGKKYTLQDQFGNIKVMQSLA